MFELQNMLSLNRINQRVAELRAAQSPTWHIPATGGTVLWNNVFATGLSCNWPAMQQQIGGMVIPGQANDQDYYHWHTTPDQLQAANLIPEGISRALANAKAAQEKYIRDGYERQFRRLQGRMQQDKYCPPGSIFGLGGSAIRYRPPLRDPPRRSFFRLLRYAWLRLWRPRTVRAKQVPFLIG